MNKERADKLLQSQDLASSREKARALIMSGLVFADGRRVEKPGQMIPCDVAITVKEVLPYVSRGGLKLEEALEAFAVSVCGKVAADLGASTGGFTDCLLQKGARKVYAVDVSTRQIDWRLKNDPRVVLLEKNARYLDKGDFAEEVDIVTADLSFISILRVLPAIRKVLGRGDLLCLLKPQFEVGRGQVGKKGVVRDPFLHEEALNRILNEAQEIGFAPRGLLKCSVRGQKGNREFFVRWALGGRPFGRKKIERLVREVVYEESS